MKKGLLVFAVSTWASAAQASSPVVLTNQLGYERIGPKKAVIEGHTGDIFKSCAVVDAETSAPISTAPVRYVGPVERWKDWVFWTVDFSSVDREGTYYLTCSGGRENLRSSPFRIETGLLERHTLSDVIYYFKGQRSSGQLDQADRALPFEGHEERHIDAHGGWFDATGDYGKHLSHLSYSSYFNPQQAPLTTWALLKSYELLLRRGDPPFRQYLRRLLDEGAWGADYLVRVHVPNGSFYRSVSAPGPGKRPQDRRVGRDALAMTIKTSEGGTSFQAEQTSTTEATYESGFRSGGGLAIAALARASSMRAAGDLQGEYLRAAEGAFSFLKEKNLSLTNDGKENIIDDYSGLLAATELFEATGKAEYRAAADERADQLMARLSPAPRSYWRADAGDRPFFHAADAGLPVASLLCYWEIADPARQEAVLKVVRASLEWELGVTREVANPFGYARQLVQTKTGRDTRFFFPHDSEAAPWWQGENARLSSLAFAARLALPRFAADRAFAQRLEAYADDQLNWILGLNPFNASMLQGAGLNNPEYRFFDSYEYTNAPGGIVNGITAGFKDSKDIDFNLPHTVTGADHDWRWGEQWLPHASWYLLAAAAGTTPPPPPVVPEGRVIIGYVFAQDQLIRPADIAAEKLTHINYAFANVKDGKVIEGFSRDDENFKALTSLRSRNPRLKILVSVGGWTWSGAFSDAVATAESRRRFVGSAVEFVERHDLDGFDVDWEYPGLPGIGNPYRKEDRENFTALMAELRTGLDALGRRTRRRYVLSFAAGASSEFLEHTEMGKLQASVDFVNLMAYDYREADADPEAGHHAGLYANPADPKQESAARSVVEFLRSGVPPEKVVLGVPFYGHAWGELPGKQDGLFELGKPVQERLETHYDALSGALVDRGGYSRKWDSQALAPYLWNGEKHIFISYEDPESLRDKCRYVREHGLRGVMFWEYFADRTGALLSTLSSELQGKP